MSTASATLDAPKTAERMFRQAGSFCFHILLSLLVYAAIFATLTYINPSDWPAAATTLLLAVIPLALGFLVHLRGRPSVATHIWIAGVVWLLMVTVYVLELPTGPDTCEHCTAVSKIWLTLFDLTNDSNLMAGAGRVIGTWPALAVVSYSIGAILSSRRFDRD